MDLGKKIAILLLLLTIGISVKMIVDRELNIDNNPQVAGKSSSWLYRRSLYISNHDFKILFEEDIRLLIDTKSLISSGKLLPNCNDIRFLDEDNKTPLRYWFEEKKSEKVGCGSEETLIWVSIPRIPVEGKTIYFLYGNELAQSIDL